MKRSPPDMGSIDTVLFDLDATLLHRKSVGIRAALDDGIRTIHAWLTTEGHHPPVLAKYAARLRFMFAWGLVRAQLTRRELCLEDKFLALHRRMRIELHRDQVEGIGNRIFDALGEIYSTDVDARTVLIALRERGCKLGIVSNTAIPAFALDRHLAQAQLLEFIPVRVYSSQTGYMKPDRRIFKEALLRLDSRADCTMFVGDRFRNDVVGPARAGMKTVYLSPTGKTRRFLRRPDFIIRRLSEVPSVLDPRPGGDSIMASPAVIVNCDVSP